MHFVEFLLAIGEQQEVIHRRRIGARPEILHDHMVHRIQVNVGEELRRLVPQRQPPAASLTRPQNWLRQPATTFRPS